MASYVLEGQNMCAGYQKKDQQQRCKFGANKETCYYLAPQFSLPGHLWRGHFSLVCTFHPRRANISCKPWRGSSVTMAIVCLSDGKLRTFCEFFGWQTYRPIWSVSAFGNSFLIDMPRVFSSHCHQMVIRKLAPYWIVHFHTLSNSGGVLGLSGGR